ncbi:hypothetical protein [Streptomyces hokutonensis]|uniref:Uncharacterized protein n=1 Tax=Streptomyces hokutonensis TaxID=1306990 RepID=A0ABW6MCB7_9ACTN
MYAFLGDRTRVLHDLGSRLREDGSVVVITPLAANTLTGQGPGGSAGGAV